MKILEKKELKLVKGARNYPWADGTGTTECSWSESERMTTCSSYKYDGSWGAWGYYPA